MAGVKKGGLGKGLGKGIGIDSLIPPEKAKSKDAVMIDIQKVEPNREQPRKNFDEDSLLELSDSIKQFGILQPLLVQDKNDYYEIIAGERRWRAAKLADLKEVPVIVKKLTDQEIVEISLIENIQREDLNPIEEAIAYKRLLDEFHLKQDEVAERVSKSRTAVTNSMRLLKLSDQVQQMVIDDLLTTGHARALLGIEDKDKQYALAQKKETPAKETPIDPKMDIIYQDLEEKMKDIMGTKVSIRRKDAKKGTIEIEYYSPEELDRIMDLFQSVKTI